MRFIVHVSFILLVPLAMAGETARSGSSGNPAAGAPAAGNSGPRCFDRADALDLVKKVQRANSTSPHKYDGFHNLFEDAAIGDDEILQRLVYAEVTAGNCGTDRNNAIGPISEVILNRVRVRGGNIRSVVFQRDQFASSLHFYDESAVRSFLCPSDTQLWAEVGRRITALRTGQQAGTLGPRAFNYYLFKHSVRFNPPAWTKTYTPAGQVGSESGLCVVAYNNPNFR